MDKRLQSLLFAVVGTALLTLAGCSLKTPGAPVWTVQATIPFSERVYRMGELVTDSALMAERGWGLRINPADGVLLLEMTDSLEYQQIGDRIKFSASDVGRYENQIGQIHIEQPQPDADTVLISDANPNLRAGFNGPVPPFSMEQAQDTLKFNVFQWVRVHSGSMILTVRNDYPFEMRNLTVDLDDPVTGQRLGRSVFVQPIPSGESASDTVDLSGSLVHNRILMTANGDSPGSPTPVTISGNEQLQILVGISQTDVDSANAEIQAQTFSNPDRLDIDSRNKIVESHISNGHAFFKLTNATPFRLTSDMMFENLFDSNGAPVQKSIILEPFSSGGLETISLSGARIEMSLNSQGLRVSNTVSIDDSRVTRYNGETSQTITGAQGVNVEYWTDELTLNRFEGIIDSITVDIPKMQTAVEFPQGLDSLRFTRDTVFVSINNESTMPLRGSFEIRASNSTSRQSVTLPISVIIAPGQNTFTVPDADRLTSVIPDTIAVEGWAGLGEKFFPDFGVGSIKSEDGFAGAFAVRSALKFVIGNTQIITQPHQLSDALDFPVQGAEMRLHMINSIPLSGTVKLLVGNDTSAMRTVIQVDIPRSAIVNRRSIAAAETTYTVDLDTSELNIMKRTPLFTQQILTFQSSLGDTAWIYPQDSLAVQASATARYTVDPNNGGK